jgi:hypothetical protein
MKGPAGGGAHKRLFYGVAESLSNGSVARGLVALSLGGLAAAVRLAGSTSSATTNFGLSLVHSFTNWKQPKRPKQQASRLKNGPWDDEEASDDHPFRPIRPERG